MIEVSDEQFHELVERAVAEIPERFAKHLDNVAFLVALEPDREQLRKSGILHGRGTLLGLYEGIPLPARGNGYNGVMPDTITVFQRPHEWLARDKSGLAAMVHQTVWHEVAHYFGLGHGAIRELERGR
jgi:predicted Zn-dependent protease with MMP-like domain